MQFNSLTFLFNFLPLFLAVYYIFPVKWRNFVLVAGSLIFYGLGCGGNFWWLKLLVELTLVTYLMGILLQRFRKGWLLGAELLMLFGCLMFFKRYHGGALLPVGMSFYLFQMAAYLMDIYRLIIPAENRFIRYAAQCTMFPKLLCGPLMEPAGTGPAAELSRLRIPPGDSGADPGPGNESAACQPSRRAVEPGSGFRL